MRSLARIALDRLLDFYPHHDVVSVEWQRDGPWLLIDLGQPSDRNGSPAGFGEPDAIALHSFAIFRATGAVYQMVDGAVNDEPLLTL